jgi:hypothetical protein
MCQLSYFVYPLLQFCLPDLDPLDGDDVYEEDNPAPVFFTFALSDGEGKRSYGAALSFPTFRPKREGTSDTEMTNEEVAIAYSKSQQMSMCILSEHAYFSNFQVIIILLFNCHF